MRFSLLNDLTNSAWWQHCLWLLLILYAGATLMQIFGYWAIFSRFAFWKDPTMPPPNTSTAQPYNHTTIQPSQPFTIVICARNEADNLRKNLPAILEQQYPVFEVLVVDDDSTDDTNLVLDQFQRQYPPLRVLRRLGKKRAGKKDALAEGIRSARHEQLLLTDADCRPNSPFWLQKMAVRLNESPENEIVLGYGPFHPGPGLLNKWARFEAVHTAMQYFSFSLAGMPYMGVGRNIAWKKKLFAQSNGFDAHAHLPSGDDDLFVNAVARKGNTVIMADPDTFAYSDAKTTWGAYYRQKRRQLTTGRMYRLGHQLCLGLCALSHTLHYSLMFFLLIINFGTIFVWLLFLIRIVSVMLVYAPILRRLREVQLLLFVPFFDAALAGFYAVFAPTVFMHNNHNKEHPWT